MRFNHTLDTCRYCGKRQRKSHGVRRYCHKCGGNPSYWMTRTKAARKRLRAAIMRGTVGQLWGVRVIRSAKAAADALTQGNCCTTVEWVGRPSRG